MKQTKKLPYFLGPEEHRLHLYYKLINKIGMYCAVFLLLANEFFIRTDLPSYRESSGHVVSKFFLALNSEFGSFADGYLFVAMPLMAVFISCLFFFQPKWGRRPLMREMKNGVPSRTDYSIAHFFFKNRVNQVSFVLWHYFMVLVALLIAVVLPSMFLSFIRSL